MEGDRSVGISNMMKMRCMMKGTGESGVACHFMHLRRHFKATGIYGHELERCDDNSIALDVVVLDNYGSGKYCTARKIDKTLALMIGDKCIDGTEAWPSLVGRSPGILDDSIGQLLDLSSPVSSAAMGIVLKDLLSCCKKRRRSEVEVWSCDLQRAKQPNPSGKSLLGLLPQHRLLSTQNIMDGMKA